MNLFYTFCIHFLCCPYLVSLCQLCTDVGFGKVLMVSFGFLQLHTFIEARTWTLQRQQNRFTPNRVLSIPGSGTVMGAQGGTGVFLPRISANGSTTVTGRSPNNQYARSGHGELIL